ncbi:MAG: TVP38/TMEM64 family protein [Rhodospirillales bacterium]|jgi:uncharacterized membrane protein YdjX (TVP38/TMEM64 family)|nr:TVP38/TMEM64 family protein [Rhodospirillales bacterium]MBT4006919.1 TVP38/TMEM64 family protein [Rhodospirillales bacterium]MBT5077055.1 TVP38/TMEM64 family protein [Rhodospirillales bacterium]MBT5113054.1 TVP38/TMEM64 family protein [Rhodospirillales bacterium]MBT5672930.1 TVP38/TMEM64 family protein [Rhodospirillales bacterium]
MNALKPYLRGFVLIGAFVAFGFLVKATGLYGLLDEAWIDQTIRGQGLSGEFIFIGAGIVMAAIGFPRQAISFLGGYAFGFGLGTALALGAVVGGSVVALYCARFLGRDFILRRFPDRIARIDGFLHDNTFSTALLIRLLPAGSNLLTNLAAGVSGTKPVPFFAGSALGYIPQTVIFALLGSGIHLDPGLRIGASVGLFIISGMLGIYLYRRYRTLRDITDAPVPGITVAPVPGRGEGEG